MKSVGRGHLLEGEHLLETIQYIVCLLEIGINWRDFCDDKLTNHKKPLQHGIGYFKVLFDENKGKAVSLKKQNFWQLDCVKLHFALTENLHFKDSIHIEENVHLISLTSICRFDIVLQNSEQEMEGSETLMWNNAISSLRFKFKIMHFCDVGQLQCLTIWLQINRNLGLKSKH